MTVVLMVAEKPSLAESLAKILSDNHCSKKKQGSVVIHEYYGNFLHQRDVLFRFTSVCGHVMSVDFQAKYNNWETVDPAQLFDVPIIQKEANPNMHIVSALQSCAKGVDYLVLWLDCDKEGENICFEVINAVQSKMQISFERPQTVFRAKFSAITEKDVKAAMRNLVLPNELESLSVDARQEADLRIGCAFTRFQTMFFHGKYGDLDSNLISYGPCQTPALGFCVERHDQIQSFRPEPYWIIAVTVTDNVTTMNLSWDSAREFNHDNAKARLAKLKKRTQAYVTGISTQSKIKQRPLALNTVELLRVASSGLGIGPHQAMQIAERLYTQGYISYPRTETNTYPKNFDLHGTVNLFSGQGEWSKYANQVLDRGINRPKSGVDAGDHPPITPMKFSWSNDFHDRDCSRIYDYIVRHFIGTLSSDLHYDQTTVRFVIGDEKFLKTGHHVTEPGFTEVMPWLALPAQQTLPSSIKVDDEWTVVEAKLNEEMTSPPGYLTEADLISLMEKHGIGTDASIPTHINNICLRNYVRVDSGRRLIPTKLGIVLVHGYQKIDPDLVTPTSRADLEKKLSQIALGQAEFRTVVRDTIAEFRGKFHHFVENIAKMDELFEVSFSTLAESGKPLSRCGKCRRYMKLIITRPMRLYCTTCNETLSLPQNGTVRVHKEIRCPLDDFEILFFSANDTKNSILCPHCYNNPPFEDMPKNASCWQCTEEKCPQSSKTLGVGPCEENCTPEALMVLDNTASHTKKWKIICNQCFLTVPCFKDASKVNVLNENCSKCDRKLMHAVSDKFDVRGCMACDMEVSVLCASRVSKAAVRGGMGGRGGISRRSGRGRGGGTVPGSGAPPSKTGAPQQKPNAGGGAAARAKAAKSSSLQSFGSDPGAPERGGGRGRGRGRGGGRGRGRGRGRGGGDGDDDLSVYTNVPTYHNYQI